MSKGTAVSQFNVGDRVKFTTDIGHKVHRPDVDKEGKTIQVFSHNVRVEKEDYGTILKLHKSGRQGSAEIHPEGHLLKTASRKVTRKLQHVSKATQKERENRL